MFKQIIPDVKYRLETRLVDVADKVKGVLLTKETKCLDDKEELVSIATRTVFIKGLGGFGDKGFNRIYYEKKPKRNPDHVAFEKI